MAERELGHKEQELREREMKIKERERSLGQQFNVVVSVQSIHLILNTL